MSLYPSLEDMKVDHMAQAQDAYAQQMHATARAITEEPGSSSSQPPAAYGAVTPSGALLYPSLDEYMGMTPDDMRDNMRAVVAVQDQSVVVAGYHPGTVAPITGQQNVGLMRAEVKSGVREVILCKDDKGKIGLRVRHINQGVFVCLVHVGSPAALAGLRFGDQILQIDGESVAGWDTDKAMKVLAKANPQKIVMAIRDRPFERTITLQKDSAGQTGFVFKDNKITAIVKDSSAARNGVLIDHHLLEINGQNVVGMKKKEIQEILDSLPRSITITIIPSFLYDHIVKSMGSSLLKKQMDHSIPDL